MSADSNFSSARLIMQSLHCRRIGSICALLLLSYNAGAADLRPDAGLQGRWTRVVEHTAFSARDTAHGDVLNGLMWLSHAYPSLDRDLWLSKDGVLWKLAQAETPYELFSTVVAFDGKLWAINKCSIWRSDTGFDWVRVLDNPPFENGAGAVVVHDGRMWQLGVGPEVWSSSDGIHWTCATHNAPYGDRNGVAVASFNGKLWLIGGMTPAPGKGYSNPEHKGYPDYNMNNDVWSSIDGANWTRVVEHAGWKPRMWFAAQAYAGRLWILGGYDNDAYANLGDVWYTHDGVHWHEFTASAPWSARHTPTTYVFDDSLWVVAGNSWPYTNDVWRLTVALAGRDRDVHNR
jgi:hypothetical protein